MCIVPLWLHSSSLASSLAGVDPWRFQAHVEVWLLMIVIIGSYVYAVKAIGPRVVTNGAVVTRRQIQCFTAGALLMWIASDWPIHDIAEE